MLGGSNESISRQCLPQSTAIMLKRSAIWQKSHDASTQRAVELHRLPTTVGNPFGKALSIRANYVPIA